MNEDSRTGVVGRILVVDDDAVSRNATINLLNLTGHVCEGAGSGEEALNRLAQVDGGFSVCILDLILEQGPGLLSGMETLRRIREDHSGTRVIVFTAHEDKGIEATANGASFYFHKPGSPYHLANLVDALVKMRQLEDHIAITADSRDQLQRIIDAMGVEVMVRDLDGNILLVNETKKRAMDLDNMVIGRSCYEVLEGKPGHCPHCPGESAVERGEIVQAEWPFEKKKKTLLINAGPVFDKSGKAVAIAEVVIDITKRKQAVQVLEQIQKASMDSVDAVAQLVVKALHEICYDRVRLYLMEEEVLVGRACEGMPQGFDMTKIHLVRDDVLAAEAFREGKAILLDEKSLDPDPCRIALVKDGVTDQIQVPLTSGGTKVGLISIDNKHSQRKFTGEDLDTVTMLGAAVADAIQNAKKHQDDLRQIRWLQGIREIDRQFATAPAAENVFLAVARTLTELLEADSALVLYRDAADGPLHVGAKCGDLEDIFVGDRPADIGIVGRCLKENQTQVVHEVATDPDFLAFRDWIPTQHAEWKEYVSKRTSLLVVPVRCDDSPIGVCVVHFTQDYMLLEWERELVENIAGRAAIALAKLEEQRQIEAVTIENTKLSDLSLMASGVAHRIRNPIAAALAMIEFAEGEELSDLGREQLAAAKTELMEAATTIDRLLRWARPSGDEPTVVSLEDVVEDLRQLVADRLEDAHIRFEIHVGDDAMAAFAAPGRIKMAILDLLVNAQTAMPNGGVLKATIRKTRAKHAVEIAISDTGRGMTEEQVQHLFDRASFTRPRPGGTGLGLYLAQKIIAGAGGRIRCESQLNVGTTFTVELPAWPTVSEEQL